MDKRGKNSNRSISKVQKVRPRKKKHQWIVVVPFVHLIHPLPSLLPRFFTWFNLPIIPLLSTPTYLFQPLVTSIPHPLIGSIYFLLVCFHPLTSVPLPNLASSHHHSPLNWFHTSHASSGLITPSLLSTSYLLPTLNPHTELQLTVYLFPQMVLDPLRSSTIFFICSNFLHLQSLVLSVYCKLMIEVEENLVLELRQ